VDDAFADVAANATVGGIVTLQVVDQRQLPCAVRAAVVHDTAGGAIVREHRFYDLDTVTTCDWIR
jgi:hypothetical protein